MIMNNFPGPFGLETNSSLQDGIKAQNFEGWQY